MAILEIMNFGSLQVSPGATPGILGRTAGIDQALAEELVRLCKGWGQASALDQSHPAILSFPLKTKVKFATKGAFAVIRVHGAPNSLFQVVVLSRSDFAAFGYNPFTVVEAGAFPPWDPAAVPGRRKLKPLGGPLPINPPPSPEDVGLVDEALHQVLTSHKLYLPIQGPTSESDRCLALLIEVMPEALKQQLRFASFAPSPANGYHLAATATAGCEFTGWRRLMMTLVGGALPDNLDSYVKKVRDCLAFGDLGVIKEQSRLLSLNRKNEEIKRTPAPSVQNPVVAAASKPKPLRKIKPAVQPKPQRSPKKNNLAQLRGGRRQLPGLVVGLLVMVVTLAGGWSYMEFFHGGGEISWDELVSWPGQTDESTQPRVATLLEVPNIGAVYNRQIKKIQMAGMIPGMNQETDQRRGLANLKNDASIPLLKQVDLFIALSGAGIRQGSRPDRESERLKAMDHQGHVLAVEMARLELAWHSLSSAENWKDLNRLSDSHVLARRDSLQKIQPSALKAASIDLNFEDRLTRLEYATRQVAGMSQLLVLFQAAEWSDKWNNDLYRAAEMVSPSASSMTRAYRNSAFTLIRLKNAEHLDAFATGAFVNNLEAGVWPDEKVADILPGLRKEARKFSIDETPILLAATLQLYKKLVDPAALKADLVAGKTTMQTLENNPAVQFDPQAYQNYLERLRYEAGLQRPGLYSENEQAAAVAFESVRRSNSTAGQWEAQFAQQELPFLKRWARHEHGQALQSHLGLLAKFDDTWGEIWLQAARLRTKAEQGRDWTAVWVDLDQVLTGGLAEASGLVKQDPAMILRMAKLQTLQSELVAPRALQLNMLTVRLDQQQLAAPEKAVFEFQVLPDGKIYLSEAFNIGPAAPMGSGWVGTVALNASVSLAPDQPFHGAVRSLNDGRELVNVQYPSLSERVGPGALARPRSSESGSLQLKANDSWWRNIKIPDEEAGGPPS